MSTLLHVSPRTVDEASSRTSVGPLLVAADGRPGSNAALSAARLLLQRRGGDVHVLSVLEPLPRFGIELGGIPWPQEVEDERREELASSVRAQVKAAIGVDDVIPLTLVAGDAGREIAKAATPDDIRFIVMGIGRHGLADRLTGSETAIKVLRLSSVPVLAVAPGFASLPHRVVIALDFSAQSIRAAREALPLLAPLATVYLVHVKPRLEIPSIEGEQWVMEYGRQVESAFERAIAEIGFPPDVAIETMTLTGDPAKEVLELSRASRADLIVIGSHGEGFFDRLMIGSVATKVLRGSTCSVLAVPPATDELDDSEGEQNASCAACVSTFARPDWIE